jgi:hypothetical protein
MPKPPLFEQTAETRLLVVRLKKMTVGEVISYVELSALISKPVDGSSGPLVTARRRMLRDFDMVIACIPGEGIQRLDDKAIVNESLEYGKWIRRKAKRSFERINKANFSTLPREYQMRFSASASVMAAVSFMTGERQMLKLESSMPSGKKELPISDTLRMFGK